MPLTQLPMSTLSLLVPLIVHPLIVLDTWEVQDPVHVPMELLDLIVLLLVIVPQTLSVMME
jgi:hypothetical protein